jgi:hypothetical protein
MMCGDDVRNPEHQRRIFDRRAGAVIFAFRLVGRNEIGDVAHDEQRAGVGVEDRRHIDARVAAGDHHGLGRLAERGELEIAALVGRVLVAAKAQMPFDQALR